MKRNYFTILVSIGACILLLSLNLSAGDNDTYRLQYKLKKGESLKYSIASKSEILQEVMGAENEMESDTKARIKLTSEGTDDDGNLSFLMVYESLMIDAFSMMGDTLFKNPPEIVGKTIKKTVAANGDQIESVEIDSIKLNQMLSQMFSIHSEFLPNLPDKEVKLGETVTVADVDSLQRMGGQIKTNSEVEFTFLAKETKAGYDCLKIAMKGTVAVEGDGKFSGMKFFVEGDGEFEGTIFFAPQEGVLIFLENQLDMETTIAVTGQQNMTIPMTQSVKSTMTLEQ